MRYYKKLIKRLQPILSQLQLFRILTMNNNKLCNNLYNYLPISS